MFLYNFFAQISIKSFEGASIQCEIEGILKTFDKITSLVLNIQLNFMIILLYFLSITYFIKLWHMF
jgi:hypothetical protein